ncbi:MAG: hypothetical protein WC635_09235 [Bacteriovorax sp.]|jgi:hypothetical protein
MKPWKTLTVTSLLALFASNAISYDVVDRYKLIDDKLKTEQMLRPYGHDFFLDVGAALNKNVTDFVDDVKKANDFQGSDAAKLANAQAVLAKYDKTEQTVKLNVALGIPVFSFSIGQLKVQPNIRVYADGGANIGIRSETLTTAMVLDLINVELPAELKAAVLAQAITPGGDILAPICPTLTDPGAVLICNANIGKYFYPTDLNAPDMLLYAKIDGRVGLFNEYTYGEHYFGNWNLYALSRTDVFQRVNANMIAKGSKVDLPAKKNTELALQTDYRLGYKNSNYRVFASVEDLKLSQMKDREAGSKELSYEYDPLMRIHADALYRFSAFSLNPFTGFHKRKGYGFADGLYLGADAGAHVWGDRLGLQLRGMFDKQYFTISPRMKLWIMQLEYSLKNPLKSTDGDVKLSAIHSIDFRLFF